MATGIISAIDYDQMDTSVKKLEDSYKSAQLTYDSSITALGALLGESDGWKPKLVSEAVISKYIRNDLSTEISHGTTESLSVWTKKVALDLQESKQTWIWPSTPADVIKNNLSTAEIEYEQAKRDAKSSIEQLYYSIDSIESQIQTAEKANSQAQQDLKIAQIKYDLGIISANTFGAGSSSLASYQIAAEKAKVSLENLKADLANQKAQFAYLTGQKVYDTGDWSNTNSATIK
jgi:outer membrane protein TolC